MNSIRYDYEAKKWEDAFPIGNGFLGAMVFGGVHSERLQVNEDSLWSGTYINRTNFSSKEHLEDVIKALKNHDPATAETIAKRTMYSTSPHMRCYQLLGDIQIDFKQHTKRQIYSIGEFTSMMDAGIPSSNYVRELNVKTAIGSIQYDINEQHFKREFFASNPDHVLVYRIESDKKMKDIEISLSRMTRAPGQKNSYFDGLKAIDNNRIILYGDLENSTRIGYEMAIAIQSDGICSSLGSHIVVDNANYIELYITGRTTYRESDVHTWCMNTLDHACNKQYDQIKFDHIQDYQSYFNLSELRLDSKTEDSIPTYKRLENVRNGQLDIGLINTYFNFGKYLLISSSRENSLPANLQGIWNDNFTPPWGSKYTININIQMNYWFCEKLGLSKLHLPLFDLLKKMYPHGKDMARDMYGARGFCCHHNTDLWGDCAPQDTNMMATIWPLGGAWLCIHVIEHYLYSRDKAFIQEYYPIIQDSILFLLDYLMENDKGYLVTKVSCSPENIYLTENNEPGALCQGPAMDMEIIRELFNGFIKVSNELQIENEIVSEVKQKLPLLAPIEITEEGIISEWSEGYKAYDKGHRHISQLFALHPGTQIRRDLTPELAKAASNTLASRLENGGGHTGWSKAWITCMYAKLGKEQEAFKHLCGLLSHSTLDNLLDNHPPFQIDGNFGGTNAILEMIIQDYEDTVYLLPALPKELNNGSIQNVYLKCGAKLSFAWKDGKIEKVEIEGLRNGFTTFVLSQKSVDIKFNKNTIEEII